MKVVYFHRKPNSTNYSIEGLFEVVRGVIGPAVKCEVFKSKYVSKGVFKRIYNILEAALNQGDINHITGDVHFLSYLMRREKTILTIHDCVVKYNEKGIKRDILRYFWYVIPERRVSVITVVSESTKKELVDFIGCDPEKIIVVPNCISQKFTYDKKVFNKENPSILQVGTGNNKNIFRLTEAIAGINCVLHVIGKLSDDQVKSLKFHRVNYIEYFGLSDLQIVNLYKISDLVAFVSTYEGFGMPILEANATGRAVVTSKILSMPEVAGDAACLVDPFDVCAIRGGILRVIRDDSYRDTLVEKGRLNVQRFDPVMVAEKYLEIYRSI